MPITDKSVCERKRKCGECMSRSRKHALSLYCTLATLLASIPLAGATILSPEAAAVEPPQRGSYSAESLAQNTTTDTEDTRRKKTAETPSQVISATSQSSSTTPGHTTEDVASTQHDAQSIEFGMKGYQRFRYGGTQSAPQYATVIYPRVISDKEGSAILHEYVALEDRVAPQTQYSVLHRTYSLSTKELLSEQTTPVDRTFYDVIVQPENKDTHNVDTLIP